MKKLAVVHYLPLEFYPPVTNFLDIAGNSGKLKILVATTHNEKYRTEYKNDQIKSIYRGLIPKKTDSLINKLGKNIAFTFGTLYRLIMFRPDKLMYYESFSALPVYIYMTLFGRKTQLFIHFHEYFSKNWYQRLAPVPVKINHLFEKGYLYKKATWISQTNKNRIRLFLEDNKNISRSKMHELPNYPPRKWLSASPGPKNISYPVKTVYIGTISLEYSYIREYCEWVIKMNENIIFDIYGYNYPLETLSYLESINSPYINFYPKGIEYEEIPKILAEYDIGLILYKALTDNFKYNAPNKLFEYLACGLNVIYSDKMLGIDPYRSERVVPVDFGKIDEIDLNLFITRQNNSQTINYNAEEALKSLITILESEIDKN